MSVVVSQLNLRVYFYLVFSTILFLAVIVDGYQFRLTTDYNIYIEQLAKKRNLFLVERQNI